jgi:hypothetical protein
VARVSSGTGREGERREGAREERIGVREACEVGVLSSFSDGQQEVAVRGARSSTRRCLPGHEEEDNDDFCKKPLAFEGFPRNFRIGLKTGVILLFQLSANPK